MKTGDRVLIRSDNLMATVTQVYGNLAADLTTDDGQCLFRPQSELEDVSTTAPSELRLVEGGKQ